jgi:hypothetical protein
LAPFEANSGGAKYAQGIDGEIAFSFGVESVEKGRHRDWELIRLFLILGLMTSGFVLIFRGIILSPSAMPRNPEDNERVGALVSRASRKDVVFEDRLGIWPLVLSPSLLAPRSHFQTSGLPATSQSNRFARD